MSMGYEHTLASDWCLANSPKSESGSLRFAVIYGRIELEFECAVEWAVYWSRMTMEGYRIRGRMRSEASDAWGSKARYSALPGTSLRSVEPASTDPFLGQISGLVTRILYSGFRVACDLPVGIDFNFV